MSDKILNYFRQVDFKKTSTRASHSSKLIFLCGAKSDTSTKDKDSQDSVFRSKLEDILESKSKNIVIAEKAMDWLDGEVFSKDLLILERYYAALVSVIPLICWLMG